VVWCCPIAFLQLNTWGYSTMNFFSPMSRYGAGGRGGTASVELKGMVKTLHAAGIEVSWKQA